MVNGNNWLGYNSRLGRKVKRGNIKISSSWEGSYNSTRMSNSFLSKEFFKRYSTPVFVLIAMCVDPEDLFWESITWIVERSSSW
jgi:hypothetical protein